MCSSDEDVQSVFSDAVADLLGKLEGDEGDAWLQELNRLLRKEISWEECNFSVWKKITIGIHKDIEALRQSLQRFGVEITSGATDILGRIPLEESRQVLDLVVISVKELGFSDGASRGDIYKAALNRKLMLCPAEVGPRLRLEYPKQPYDEELIIGMEPIVGSDGWPKVFLVARWSDLELSSLVGNVNSRLSRGWNRDALFVFVRPQKTS